MINNILKDSDAKWFIYTRQQPNAIHYQYVMVNVEENSDGTYAIVGNNDFSTTVIQTEDYNLGTRYFVVEKATGIKRIGRIERKTIVRNDIPKYYINKASYQEQRRHLWSPVISRLAEMYLIRAEANAMLGQSQTALDDVNILRARAGIPQWTLQTISDAGKDINMIIEEERQMEFAFEGHRRFDVFRKRQTLDKRYPGYHTRGEASTVRLEIPWNDNAVCEFLPQRQLDAYPYPLEQNP